MSGPIIIDYQPTRTDLNRREVSSMMCTTMQQEWELKDEFRCTTCNKPPYAELLNPFRWGCVHCKFTTINPGIYFKRPEAA